MRQTSQKIRRLAGVEYECPKNRESTIWLRSWGHTAGAAVWLTAPSAMGPQYRHATADVIGRCWTYRGDDRQVMIRYGELERCPEEWRDRFAEAEPFPHLVIDDLLEPGSLRDAVREFPAREQMPERPGRKGMLELADPALVPPLLADVSHELLGERFTRWLSFVSGIDGLTTDPGGSWGALRQSGDGVEGKIHVPPVMHPTRPWYRRLTLILHLTDGMGEGNGGCFQLWDAAKDAPRVSIAPLFNRAVVFLATPRSFHSVSPTRLGPGETRKVMQALYYTEDAPTERPLA